MHEPTSSTPARLLMTAGPTHEPIDAVRFIGNRSSGRLGCALADEAASRGWFTRLLLGPATTTPQHPDVAVERFRTTDDLDRLLQRRQPETDVLIMAAAVADYRPRVHPEELVGKTRRRDDDLTITLEPTPDLLAACASRRRPDQLLVGFALEPRAELLDSARRKLERKGVDLVVANPLETMESGEIEATIVARAELDVPDRATHGPLAKHRFAAWLLDVITETRRNLKNPASERISPSDVNPLRPSTSGTIHAAARR